MQVEFVDTTVNHTVTVNQCEKWITSFSVNRLRMQRIIGISHGLEKKNNFPTPSKESAALWGLDSLGVTAVF